MRLRSFVFPLVLLAATTLASEASAQVRFGEFGFVVSGTNGAAGDGCWGFDCMPRPLAVVSGETLSVTVRAPLGAPYAVFVSTGLGSCIVLPGINNAFNLDPSFVAPLFASFVDMQNFARYCYDGLTVQSLPLPPAAIGTTIYLQAAAVVGTPQFPATGLALASVVQLTVQ